MASSPTQVAAALCSGCGHPAHEGFACSVRWNHDKDIFCFCGVEKGWGPKPTPEKRTMASASAICDAAYRSADEARLYEVEITAGTHGDPGGYWGWWENEGRHWAWVFGSKVQCEVCFPYGSKAEEERGRGWMLPVDVKVIGKAHGGSNG